MKQTTIRVNPEVLKELHRRFPFFEKDSELIRFAMQYLLIEGSK